MKDLSVGANLVWQIAGGEAVASKHQFIEREHILIGICSLDKALELDGNENSSKSTVRPAVKVECDAIKDVLKAFKLNSTRIKRKVREELGKGDYKHLEKVVHRSEDCKKLFKQADTLSSAAKEISCLSVFAAVLDNPGDIINSVIINEGVKPADLQQKALTELDKVQPRAGRKMPKVRKSRQKVNNADTRYLDRYGRDLTLEARNGKLGPFIGRRSELLQIIQTLSRRVKNNPVLVGEEGVGKTAIVEALAVRMAQGKDAHILGGKRIVELNIGSLGAGAKRSGDFEERITRILQEAHAQSEVILFIDEIHKLLGAGSAEGIADAANLMKSALDHGDFRWIGTTTITAYRRCIESDAALERRIDKIIINEPSRDETIAILKGLRQKFEDHYRTQITDKAIESAVNLSVHFDLDHQLPDKAIDLVDRAAASVRMPALSMIGNFKSKDGGANRYDKAVVGCVTEINIAQVLADKKGLPLELITSHLEGIADSRLLKLEPFLNGRIIGQHEAISQLCQRLLVAHAGLSKRHGPLAVFLLIGSPGVGKTESARSLAEFLFGSESNIMRFDMTEYIEEKSVTKLVGSLASKLRTKPYSVVLLNAIEEANPAVLDLLLQVFDEGRIIDAKGRTVDAGNAIFIMTANIAAIKKMGFIHKGKDESKAAITAILRQKFRAEFINHVDEQIIFRSLSKDDIRKIAQPMLAEIGNDLKKKYKVNLQFSDEAEDFLAEVGYDTQYGAQELRRTIERYIQAPLSRLILSGEMKKHSNWHIVCSGEVLSIVPVGEETV